MFQVINMYINDQQWSHGGDTHTDLNNVKHLNMFQNAELQALFVPSVKHSQLFINVYKYATFVND